MGLHAASRTDGHRQPNLPLRRDSLQEYPHALLGQLRRTIFNPTVHCLYSKDIPSQETFRMVQPLLNVFHNERPNLTESTLFRGESFSRQLHFFGLDSHNSS